MMRGWNSPVYAFFWPVSRIEDNSSCHCHVFECYAAVCKGKGHDPRLVRCYLDTTNHTSTKNLQWHAEICWGEETIQKGCDVKNLAVAKEEVAKVRKSQSDGSITTMFSRMEGKGKVTYSHCQHTSAETRYVILSLTLALLLILLQHWTCLMGVWKYVAIQHRKWSGVPVPHEDWPARLPHPLYWHSCTRREMCIWEHS